MSVRRVRNDSGGQNGRSSEARHRTIGQVSGKLENAPIPVCLIVMACYGILSLRGFAHIFSLVKREDSMGQKRQLDRDFTALVTLYLTEVVGAVLFGFSTMYRWSRRHFLEHHLPLVVLFGLQLSQNQRTQGRATSQHHEWMALVLLISFNEMTAALLIIWPNKHIEKYRIVPNILIQFSLLLTETTSWFRATFEQLFLRTDPSMWLATLFSQFLLAAAFVHYTYLSKLSRLFVKLFLAYD